MSHSCLHFTKARQFPVTQWSAKQYCDLLSTYCVPGTPAGVGHLWCMILTVSLQWCSPSPDHSAFPFSQHSLSLNPSQEFQVRLELCRVLNWNLPWLRDDCNYWRSSSWLCTPTRHTHALITAPLTFLPTLEVLSCRTLCCCPALVTDQPWSNHWLSFALAHSRLNHMFCSLCTSKI